MNRITQILREEPVLEIRAGWDYRALAGRREVGYQSPEPLSQLAVRTVLSRIAHVPPGKLTDIRCQVRRGPLELEPEGSRAVISNEEAA